MRALGQYQSTIGRNHHRTADACHKAAQHCMRHGNFKDALALIDQALRVWNADRDVYLHEIARTSFLKAKILFHLEENSASRKSLFKQAASGWKLITSKEVDYKQLTEEHFDELVTVWSG